MGRALMAVVVTAGMISLGGLFSYHSLRPNTVEAQSRATASHEAAHSSSNSAAPFTNTTQLAAHTETALSPPASRPTNRFDRGRLDEKFDGELKRARPYALAQAGSAPARPRSFQEDSAAPPLVPRRPILDSAPPVSIQDDDAPSPLSPPLEVPNWNALSRVRPANPPLPDRVVLLRSPDQQIRIMAECQSVEALQNSLSPGAVAIIAEEFSLTPVPENEGRIALNCTGRVEVYGQDFIARCSKLSVRANDLQIEGTQPEKAEIIRQPKAAKDVDSATTNPEFRVSASRINFTLSFDKLQVGGALAITPIPGANPMPPATPILDANPAPKVHGTPAIEESAEAILSDPAEIPSKSPIAPSAPKIPE